MIASPGVSDQAWSPPWITGRAIGSLRNLSQLRRKPSGEVVAFFGSMTDGAEAVRRNRRSSPRNSRCVRLLWSCGRDGELAASAPPRTRRLRGRRSSMPSLIRFVSFLGLLAVLACAGMFALVSWVEPTQREFVVTIRRIAWARRRPAPPTQTPSAIRAGRSGPAAGRRAPAGEGNREPTNTAATRAVFSWPYHHKARGSSDPF